MSRRVQSGEAATLMGLSLRAVQSRAARGEIPGAAKLFGTWTFDPVKLAKFISGEESKCAAMTTFTKGPASIGCAPRSAGASIEKAYERAISKARGGYATPGLKQLSALSGMASAAGRGLRPSLNG